LHVEKEKELTVERRRDAPVKGRPHCGAGRRAFVRNLPRIDDDISKCKIVKRTIHSEQNRKDRMRGATLLRAGPSFLLATALRTVTCAFSAIPPSIVAETNCWRPTKGDVDAISWGRRAKKRGTGSRGVPHRLNDDERTQFDVGRARGFVELRGSGWRRQRSDAPLRNTYRSWCDATAVAAIFVHKGGDGLDEVVIDFSPLRAPEQFEAAAQLCLAESGASDGCLEPLAPRNAAFMELSDVGISAEGEEEGSSRETTTSTQISSEEEEEEGFRTGAFSQSAAILHEAAEAYRTEPIYRLPMYAVSWVRPRSDAKALAKALAARFSTATRSGGGRAKARGAPDRAHGKSRRHGGYGIG
jgi:hypothetical protein